MSRITSFFKTPLGILVIVLVLVFLYSKWRTGAMASLPMMHPSIATSPVVQSTAATVASSPRQ